jgi:UDP-2-acetamido-2,6-beta-L-arabino-hexul-4-ose reductase
MLTDKKLKIGITGQSGFMGTHMFNTLGLSTEKFERIPFYDDYFQSQLQLDEFVSSCDVILHLAAMNRHHDPKLIYDVNMQLVRKVIDACERTNIRPHIIFSSSTQEERDNLYGQSKREGRQLFEDWAVRNNTRFTGMIIPNVFGPFGLPYYNSVVATFCHQLTHNESPKIETDSEMKLIYINELICEILKIIETENSPEAEGHLLKKYEVQHTSVVKVSELLDKLSNLKETYFYKGILPELTNSFDINLFNTFLTYISHKDFFPFMLQSNVDQRGNFVEIAKLNSGGQVSFSTTKPGITRGNHFHTRKAERFAVIKGKALIELRRIGTDEKIILHLDGENPSFVDMPVWHTHNITNVGEEDLYTIFWINEHFNPDDPDTFFEEV